MTREPDRLAVLTFHSIGAGRGPTRIDAETFGMQLDELVAQDYSTLCVDEFVAWHRDGDRAPGRRVLLTFDDGFADFATTAFPLLRARGFGAVVFVPTARIGGAERWEGAPVPGRPLLDWATLRELAASGIEFGGHGRTHADLTRLPAEARRDEIASCGRELANRLGRPTRCFAAPYGRVDAAVVADIAASYDVAFGTGFDRASRDHPRHDLPRIEMHYFRERRHWRDFLLGRDRYFRARRLLRSAGIALRALLPRRRT